MDYPFRFLQPTFLFLPLLLFTHFLLFCIPIRLASFPFPFIALFVLRVTPFAVTLIPVEYSRPRPRPGPLLGGTAGVEWAVGLRDGSGATLVLHWC